MSTKIRKNHSTCKNVAHGYSPSFASRAAASALRIGGTPLAFGGGAGYCGRTAGGIDQLRLSLMKRADDHARPLR